MRKTIDVEEFKRELHKLNTGAFRLGYLYADDLIHLREVYRILDELLHKEEQKTDKDCNGCFGASFGDCEICDERGEDR